jgi:hypothetical protein
MLSHLDNIIFPDRCEVIEIIPSQRYFYSIFKNGSSSIYKYMINRKLKIYINDQIKRLSSIDVVIREPQQRLISGINSFVAQTLYSNPHLDKDTVFWFAKNYLHINRHYSMQFSWLLNLARYTSPDAKINLQGMDTINQITDYYHNPWNTKDESLLDEILNLPAQEMYHRIDMVLFNAVGQSLTFREITDLIKAKDSEASSKRDVTTEG